MAQRAAFAATGAGAAGTMLAMQYAPATGLAPVRLPVPVPGPGQVLLRVAACGVCRTDLHLVDGELAPHRSPVVPGHEVVGYVERAGEGVRGFRPGERAGAAWLAGSCGRCRFCLGRRENLCAQARFTGYDIDGGYAGYALADARFLFHLPDRYDDIHAAPLLCAGLIGYRAWAMAGAAQHLGLYGFGAAAHLLAQLALGHGQDVYAFTRPGDTRSQDFARGLGAVWAGGTDQAPPQPLDAAILFAPAGALVPLALSHVRKGGTVVCAGIHMSDIPSFPYTLLWGERCLRSVANLTRADGEAFFELAAVHPLSVQVRAYPLADAAAALDDLRHGRYDGAAVLVP